MRTLYSLALGGRDDNAIPWCAEYIFRPPGFQPGHNAEWAKLLVLLDRHYAVLSDSGATNPSEHTWLLETAESLFASAVDHGWDEAGGGGLVYLVEAAEEGSSGGRFRVRDGNKYYWALAEMIGAAGVLAVRVAQVRGDEAAKGYWRWYDRAWAYALDHFIDRERGGWYPMLNARNVRVDTHAAAGHTGTPVKCYPSKTDYHPFAACWEVLRALDAWK
jgi:mannose/cellobiose epimerase-like protein (N-acyl-D-glucosamine 2-epimerase family)